MIIEEANYVKAHSIGDAWRDVMWLCVKNGWDFMVKGGSYVGQIRKQLEHVHIVINYPGTRPLSPIMPPAIPGPTNEEKIETYFVRYIMSGEKDPNEEYTYGEFIVKQLPRVIQLLIDSKGNTNQATICIGNAETTFLPDPPCLRSISFKVVEGKLNMCVYFRSWDLYAGLPENLGGLQLLKEYVLDAINHSTKWTEEILDGKIIAFSDGLHIYEQYFDIVDCLNVDKIKVGEKAKLDKEKFIIEEGT
jgi:thymidylate synthase